MNMKNGFFVLLSVAALLCLSYMPVAAALESVTSVSGNQVTLTKVASEVNSSSDVVDLLNEYNQDGSVTFVADESRTDGNYGAYVTNGNDGTNLVSAFDSVSLEVTVPAGYAFALEVFIGSFLGVNISSITMTLNIDGTTYSTTVNSANSHCYVYLGQNNGEKVLMTSESISDVVWTTGEHDIKITFDGTRYFSSLKAEIVMKNSDQTSS